ncbi:MAG: putative ABC-type uncharacterized transport system involved in gliding motility auxiliary, partial [Dehalococcoidia bacterium]|nr:putative ABC-type uncharacterized transport system involved in gliding motility auxiliary [Dehalococcoidia bacterium]
MSARKPPGVRRLADTVTRSLGTVTSAALVGGVAALVAAGVVRLIYSRLTASYLALLAIGLLLLLLATATGFNTVRATLISRRGFYGFNTTLMILLFLAITTVIVLAGTANNVRIDTTAAKEFTLAQQTSEVLKGLKQDIEAVAFFAPTDPLQTAMRGRAQDLLEEYRQTTGRFRYRIVDPDVEPEEARRYGINPDARPATIVLGSWGNLQPVDTLLFTSGGGYEPNENLERDFTQAI